MMDAVAAHTLHQLPVNAISGYSVLCRRARYAGNMLTLGEGEQGAGSRRRSGPGWKAAGDGLPVELCVHSASVVYMLLNNGTLSERVWVLVNRELRNSSNCVLNYGACSCCCLHATQQQYAFDRAKVPPSLVVIAVIGQSYCHPSCWRAAEELNCCNAVVAAVPGGMPCVAVDLVPWQHSALSSRREACG